MQRLLWKGIRWPMKICIQLASHHQNIHNISCRSYLELWIQCHGSHFTSDATMREHWTRTTFFLTVISANPDFQIPILHSIVNAGLTIHKPETSTSNSSNSKMMIWCLPHILAMVLALWQWRASMCKVTKEFYSLILRSYLLKEMPIFEKCNLLYISGWLLVLKLHGAPPTMLHDI